MYSVSFVLELFYGCDWNDCLRVNKDHLGFSCFSALKIS